MKIVCVVCKRTFDTSSPTAKTCSNACRQRLKRWRAEDRRRAEQALTTISGLYGMHRDGLDDTALEYLVKIHDKVEGILNYLKWKSEGIPQQLPAFRTEEVLA